MPDTKDPNQVTLVIDGRSVTVPKGTLVVEAARRLGIEIPVFCYHHKMDPVGACRLCLVELTPGPPRAQTACTTPAAEGMTVQTRSTMAVGARADILEFELVNHPLDCPVCDKGGECPLQDYTFGHGYPVSRLDDPKLHFRKPIPLSPRIALDRERCVLCYRCTRYYDEIAWEQELTVDQRGVHSYITSQFDQPLTSIFSGNIIDLCPVGALTSRVWRFESRSWDMDHSYSVCSMCSVGCSVTLWQRRGHLVRVTSHENDEIDEGWICDRGRFDYTHVNDPARLRTPTIGTRAASWEEALRALADGLGGVRPSELALSIPQDITNEEIFLLWRLLKGAWKGARVLMERRTMLPAPDGADLKIADLDRARVIVVIASDTREDVPIINLRIKKAVRKLGAQLVVVHPDRLDLTERWPRAFHVRPGPEGTPAAVRALIGQEVLAAGPVAILYGDGRGSEDAGELAAAVRELAEATGAAVMPLYRGTNERGALAAGILGPAPDLDGVKAMLCWGPPAVGIPPDLEFLAIWDTVARPEHGQPQVTLPAVSFAESQGSYINVEGRVQFLRPILPVRSPLREGWEVLADLGLLLGVESDFAGPLAVQRAAAHAIAAFATLAEAPVAPQAPSPVLMGPARP